MDKQTVGRIGEEKACEFLIQNSMRILERNFRCRLGELDIIAWDGDQLVFIEVRTRSSNSFAAPEETVGSRKQQKLRNLANYYLSRKFGRELNCRFDVVTLLLDREGNAVKINHFQGAFY
ncbi:MAG: YraN family protein [Carboxydocellales bacterium]